MNGWEFVKYFMDKAYDHYIVTFCFLLAVVPWNRVNLNICGKDKEKHNE